MRNRRLVHGLLAPDGNGREPETGISAAQSVRLLTVIARAAAHTPLLGRLDGLLTDVCTRHAGRLGTATMDVATQVERPQPLVDALWMRTEDPATPLAELADLADRLPDRSHVLADWALRLMERLVEVRTAARAVTAEDTIALGVDHRRLAKRLLELNRAAKGLEAADRAVELLESLMETDPGAVRFHLAAALNNRAVCLGVLGRRSEAIEPAHRAVEHYRIVVGGDSVPPEAPGQLVRCLSGLSDAQRNLGRHKDALRTAEEAVAVERTFVPDGGPEAVSSLAARLNNLSIRHTDLGQYRQAFEAAAEAVDLCEPLAEQYPDAYLNDLSRVLGTLSTCYGGLGDREKALELAQRCVDIRERLHRDRPETYRHDLAQGLNSLAIDLGELGHMDRAAAVAERSVELFRKLDGPHARGRRHELANVLNTLANRRADIGDPAGALEAIKEACDIYRELDTELPGVFTADLAMCLGTMASCLEGLGRREDAIALSFEAVELNRRLVPRDPGSIAVYFAAVLHNLRLYLEAAGRTADALELVDEGLATYADPHAAHAVALYPVTAELLLSRAMCLRELGRTDESMAPARELVEIARRMAVLPSGPGPPTWSRSSTSSARSPSAPGTPPRARTPWWSRPGCCGNSHGSTRSGTKGSWPTCSATPRTCSPWWDALTRRRRWPVRRSRSAAGSPITVGPPSVSDSLPSWPGSPMP
ncbi:tetratricopeptide repeat protein [Kitasatospora arboriphila]